MTTEASQRASNACENCRRRKVKCSGDQPCRGCLRHNVECTYGGGGRKRFSETYVQGLLARIQSYERRINDNAAAEPPSDLGLDSYNTRGPTEAKSSNQHATLVSNSPAQRTGDHAQSSRSLPQELQSPSNAPDLAGPAFESQARTLLDRSRHNHISHLHAVENSQHTELSDTTETSVVPWQSVKDLTQEDHPIILPTEPESHRLLELFLLYLGSNQHFLDPRAFSDSMTLLYRSSVSRQRQQSSVWFTQYLLIMAMAKLMDVNSESDQRVPGSTFFAEAIRRLPPAHSLGEHGVVSVEILALVALYLQWCDKKHDAYLYIGLAMRLAIALGCYQPPNMQQCLPSEATHRLRLWWTVFMLDRRLSCSLGLPVGADDRQIRSELPQAAAGFPSHVPIVINVRIATATGNIMSSLYGNTAMSQEQLVQSMQDILQSLYETGKTIPPEFEIDFTRPHLHVTRTGASLYMMLFQAIILCVRPIVLQCVRQNILDPQSPQSRPTVVQRLCQTCDEAARKSLRMLSALQQRGIIARFGFFDLDATFAAAFILVMLCSMENDKSSRPPREIRMACEVLAYLSKAGNKAAQKRLDDITQFCGHVWPNYSLPGLINPVSETTRAMTNSDRNRQASDITAQAQMQQQGSMVQSSPDGRSSHSGSESFVNWLGMAQFDVENVEFDLGPEADGIYSSFNDPNFHLTGVDYSDWQEMEKIFAERQG